MKRAEELEDAIGDVIERFVTDQNKEEVKAYFEHTRFTEMIDAVFEE